MARRKHYDIIFGEQVIRINRKEMKALVKNYKAARKAFDKAPDDDCLDDAIDALAAADWLAHALETLLAE